MQLRKYSHYQANKTLIKNPSIFKVCTVCNECNIDTNHAFYLRSGPDWCVRTSSVFAYITELRHKKTWISSFLRFASPTGKFRKPARLSNSSFETTSFVVKDYSCVQRVRGQGCQVCVARRVKTPQILAYPVVLCFERRCQILLAAAWG